ncbi:MAG TPA: DEAD/DEAH box helicase [Methylophilaceae bacterium]|nr:DEAD/DEAH box helicase [Methylophilaceae bacterium]
MKDAVGNLCPPAAMPVPGAAWLAQQGWHAFPFQQAVWEAVAGGESGLLHATTGAGKTYAAWLAALNCYAACTPRTEQVSTADAGVRKRQPVAPPLTVLWLTPMRAVAADTERALRAPVNDLDMDWSIGLRTGDTDSAERARQAKRLPTALITTPESLTLLLTRADAGKTFAGLRMVVVDEWHELIGNKRGVQVQLALARLRLWNRASWSGDCRRR